MCAMNQNAIISPGHVWSIYWEIDQEFLPSIFLAKFLLPKQQVPQTQEHVCLCPLLSLFLDLNECSNSNGGCNSTCSNSIGSYSCSCEAGYQLAVNLHDCKGRDRPYFSQAWA